MLLQRRCASDYSVVGWRNVMAVTKMLINAKPYVTAVTPCAISVTV